MLVEPDTRRKELDVRVDTIDLVVYDFDGVMTDNRVIVFQDGTEAVVANRADGLGVDRFRNWDIPQLILSTETNPVVIARANKLGIEVITGCADKARMLIEYCEQHAFALERVIYVGNDINDLEAMRLVGYPVAPADAHSSIRSMAKLVVKAKGGEGVVKELSERLSVELGPQNVE